MSQSACRATRRRSARCAAKGAACSRGACTTGVKFAYLSTDEDLGVVTEIFDWPEGLVQEPDGHYPAVET